MTEISDKDRVWPLLSEIEPEVRAKMAAPRTIASLGAAVR